MTKNIKNFIEEGEKNREQWVKELIDLSWSPQSADEATLFFIEKFSSRQISLIKMIVKMCESEKKKYSRANYDGNNLKTAEDYYGISALDWKEIIRLEDGANQALNTISSKLKELIK